MLPYAGVFSEDFLLERLNFWFAKSSEGEFLILGGLHS